jgi:hypothetical protein
LPPFWFIEEIGECVLPLSSTNRLPVSRDENSDVYLETNIQNDFICRMMAVFVIASGFGSAVP